MNYAVISPVGTSLFNRAFGVDAEQQRAALASVYDPSAPWSRGKTGSNPPRPWSEALQRIQRYVKDQDANHTEATCSAEIKSILAMAKKRGDNPVALTLLATATAESSLCAIALREYFRAAFSVEPQLRIVDGMDYGHPEHFERTGIREFLQQLRVSIDAARNDGLEPVLNATPGFKAESGLALLLAQLMGVTVFYLHELMDRVVVLPSLPLTITPEFWQRRGDLVEAVGNCGQADGMPYEKFARIAETHRAALGPAENLFEICGGQVLLSAIGTLFYEAFGRRGDLLPDSTVPLQNRIVMPTDEHHWPKDTEQLLQKLAQLGFVCRIAPFSFSNSADSRITNRFDSSSPGTVVLQYSDSDYAVKMNVDTTASDYDGWSAAKRSLDAALLEWGYTAATPGQEDSAAPAELGTRDIHELILDLERRAAQLQEELNGVEAKYQEHQRDLKALASKQQSSLQKQLNKRQSDLAEQNNRLTAADRKYARLERRLAAFRTAARNRPKLGPPR